MNIEQRLEAYRDKNFDNYLGGQNMKVGADAIIPLLVTAYEALKTIEFKYDCDIAIPAIKEIDEAINEPR